MTDFASLGLAEPLVRAVTAEGYATPTPIQAAAIPLLIAGHDLVGIAQTGTGKTAAFVLPLLHALASGERGRPAPGTARALVLAPTRELAAQIADAVRAYGQFMRISVAVVVGGAKPGPQVKALARGVDILVATPGRLFDHMSTGAARLNQTDAVVLDEADQMMDLGFLPTIRRIMSALPKDRQTLLFSATMPKQIRALANDFLHKPREVAVTPQSRPIERIAQHVMHVDGGMKRAALLHVLKEADVGQAIVFTRTKHGADKVSMFLENAGLYAAAIHGNKSQSQRERALGAFKTGQVQILVATDIAARGIDIDGVSHVVNYELPNVPESYVHRIGRTARAGAAGVAISLCDSSERPFLRDIERLIGKPVEQMTCPPDLVRAAPMPAQPAYQDPRRQASQRAETDRRDRPREQAFRPNSRGPEQLGQEARKQADRRDAHQGADHGGKQNGERPRAPHPAARRIEVSERRASAPRPAPERAGDGSAPLTRAPSQKRKHQGPRSGVRSGRPGDAPRAA